MSQRKWYRKKRYISLLVIAGLILLAAILWPFIIPDIVESKIQQRLSLEANEKLELTNLSVGIFPLSLSADSVLVEKTVKGEKHQWLLQSQLRDLDINLGVWQFLDGSDKITVSKVNWSGGYIHFSEKEKVPSKDSSKSKKSRTIVVEQIDLGQTKLKLARDTQEVEANLQLALKQLEIGKTSMPQWQSLKLEVNDFFAKAISPDYNLSFKSLTASSHEKSLVLKKLAYETRFPHKRVQEKYEHMQVQQEVRAEEMEFNGIELNRLGEGFYAQSINFKNGEYDIYQDSRKPVKKDTNTLPSGKPLQTKYPFRVDTFRMQNSKLVYEEMTKRGLARLVGNNWNAEIRTLTNIGYSQSVPLYMHSTIDFYNAAPLSLTARFDSASPSHSFTVSGNFGKNEMKNFNPILKPILGLYFESGTCNQIRFEMRGNDERIDGELFADYTGVSIGFGSYDSNIFKNAAEWTASQVAINQDEEGTKHEFTYKRIPTRSFINYWWKALEKGLLDVLLALGLSE